MVVTEMKARFYLQIETLSGRKLIWSQFIKNTLLIFSEM